MNTKTKTKTEYIYIESFGAVYRLTQRGFERFLKKTVKQGYPPEITEYGIMLCIINRFISGLDN
jgi:hypothetical protein